MTTTLSYESLPNVVSNSLMVYIKLENLQYDTASFINKPINQNHYSEKSTKCVLLQQENKLTN